MSTTIESVPSSKRLVIEGQGLVYLGIHDGVCTPIKVDRADFLAAVAAECGVIVIDRAELPLIGEPDRCGLVTLLDGAQYALDDQRDERALALNLLALAEYRKTHPPVDEAQVEALERALVTIDEHVGADTTWDVYARRLVAAGWSK